MLTGKGRTLHPPMTQTEIGHRANLNGTQVGMNGKSKKILGGDPSMMMHHAQSLGALARQLRSDYGSSAESELFDGAFIAVPVLYAFAMELALKAWQARENDGCYDSGHDLLKLFDGLNETTKKSIELDYSRSSGPLFGELYDPVMSGIRETLKFHRKSFVEWRYLHEPGESNKTFYDPALDEALLKVIRAYWKS